MKVMKSNESNQKYWKVVKNSEKIRIEKKLQGEKFQVKIRWKFLVILFWKVIFSFNQASSNHYKDLLQLRLIIQFWDVKARVTMS